MGYFLASLAMIGWGFLPIIATLRKSNPVEQTLGISITALIFSSIVFFTTDPKITNIVIIAGLLSGFFWSIGQTALFRAIQFSSISKSMPIMTGGQIVVITLCSIFIFKEWSGVLAISLSLLAMLAVIIGSILTTFSKQQKQVKNNTKKNIYILLAVISAFCFAMYVAVTTYFGVNGTAVFLPQAVGMVSGTLIINLFYKQPLKRTNIIFNLTGGVAWSIANMGLFLATSYIGVALSFSISQAQIIIATIGSIIIFKERKEKKEWVSIITGITLIMLGVTLIGFIKAGI